jgi:hypothetical protein
LLVEKIVPERRPVPDEEPTRIIEPQAWTNGEARG